MAVPFVYDVKQLTTIGALIGKMEDPGDQPIVQKSILS